MQLLTLADIDFLALDTTNGVLYLDICHKLFTVLEELRQQGWKTPQVVFFTNTSSGEAVDALYNEFYKKGLYRSHWFIWEDKPLIIGRCEECGSAAKSFFTFRRPQWPNEPDEAGAFPWMDWRRPQKVYVNGAGEKETVSVSVAQHPGLWFSDSAFYGLDSNWGRSYHPGQPDQAPSAVLYGRNFQEQWDVALKEDPSIVFVTGWNEWLGMRFPGSDPSRPIRFLDTCSMEYSRDIEPMQGGYADSYYMQLVANIRRFKGVQDTKIRLESKISWRKPFTQWQSVDCVYPHFLGNGQKREHAGFGGYFYETQGAANDIMMTKLACDKTYLHFYLEAVRPWSKTSLPMLLLNTGGSYDKGWLGYDYVVNRVQANGPSLPLEHSPGGWYWQSVGNTLCRLQSNMLHLLIRRDYLRMTSIQEPAELHFKWYHGPTLEGDPMAFYLDGDAAPSARFNYVVRYLNA
jgi:hypothetical protein